MNIQNWWNWKHIKKNSH